MQNKPQLFCFSYAGGTAAFFDVIDKDLDSVELVKLEYAGHGERYKEHLYNSFNQLADDLFCTLVSDYHGGTYSLFGYSMGCISLVEVLKRIIASKMNPPKCIFLAAHAPQTSSDLLTYTTDKQDKWVKERTIMFGSIPEVLKNNKVFWRTYLPVYRADYSLIAQYEFETLDIKERIPATIFYSETDTSKHKMKLWEKYFPCEFYQFDGNHFFIHEHHSEMATIIMKQMGILENDV